MKLTTEKIAKYFNQIEALYNTDEQRAKDQQLLQTIIRKDREFSTAYPECTQHDLEALGEARKDVAYTKVLKQLKNHYNEKYTMRFTTCLVMANALMIDENKQIRRAHDIKERFTDLKRIGEPSVFGIVLRGKLQGFDSMFVLKTTNKNLAQSNVGLLHELVIGGHLNNLRDNGVLNFAYTYGSFVCSPPVIDEKTREVLEWCSSSNPKKITYVVYEDIDNAISVQEYLRLSNGDPLALASLVLQLAMATRIANDRYGYTHYDLHLGNIMMREPPGEMASKPFYLPYTNQNNKCCHILADRIATIIDYETAYVTEHGVPVLAAPVYRKYNDRSLPLHDMFKLVCTLAVFIFGENFKDEIKQYVLYLLNFFFEANTIDKAKEFLSAEFNNRFSLPDTLVGSSTIIDFIHYVFEHQFSRDVIKLNPRSTIPTLVPKNPKGFNEIFEQTVTSSKTSFFDLYSDSSYSTVENIPEDFDYESALNELKSRVSDAIQESVESSSRTEVIELTKTNILTRTTLKAFGIFVNQVIVLFTRLDELERLLNTTIWIQCILENENSTVIQSVQDLESAIKTLGNQLLLILKSLSISISTIEDVRTTYRYRTKVSQNEKFGFYVDKLEFLNNLIGRTVSIPDEQMIEIGERIPLASSATGAIVHRSLLEGI
jgi:hypothetical protein